MGAEIAEMEKQTPDRCRKEWTEKSELMRDYSVKSERVHTVNQLLKAYALVRKGC